ncbi:hypothetical protein DNTS_014342, partial [Danionella cerebrum]
SPKETQLDLLLGLITGTFSSALGLLPAVSLGGAKRAPETPATHAITGLSDGERHPRLVKDNSHTRLAKTRIRTLCLSLRVGTRVSRPTQPSTKSNLPIIWIWWCSSPHCNKRTTSRSPKWHDAGRDTSQLLLLSLLVRLRTDGLGEFKEESPQLGDAVFTLKAPGNEAGERQHRQRARVQSRAAEEFGLEDILVAKATNVEQKAPRMVLF